MPCSGSNLSTTVFAASRFLRLEWPSVDGRLPPRAIAHTVDTSAAAVIVPTTPTTITSQAGRRWPAGGCCFAAMAT